MNEALKAPFVWFGGKRKVAAQVWEALGDVDNYVEPFAGSLAVLLGRPIPDEDKRIETVNDADGFICNFWRALANDPEGVAHYADYPVNETDLFARHLWLVTTGRSILLNNLEADPEFYDVRVAGYWVWGINSWIGSGWCSGSGPWMADDEGIISKRPPRVAEGRGVKRQRPHLGTAGRGVKRQRPHLGTAGQGVKRQRPHLGDAGQGVNRQPPHLGNAGQAGFWTLENRRHGISNYFLELANRLRDVRVINGDWSRVVTNGALSFGSTIGVFLDPPYLGDVRTADLYAVDDHHIAHEVRQWCLDNGDRPNLRIVLAGYHTEHDHLMPDTWRRITWSASVAYQTTNSAATKGGNADNRHLETLWCSPACINPDKDTQMGLFA